MTHRRAAGQAAVRLVAYRDRHLAACLGSLAPGICYPAAMPTGGCLCGAVRYEIDGNLRQAVNQYLQEWRAKGWVDVGRGRVTVLDESALQTLASP